MRSVLYKSTSWVLFNIIYIYIYILCIFVIMDEISIVRCSMYVFVYCADISVIFGLNVDRYSIPGIWNIYL